MKKLNQNNKLIQYISLSFIAWALSFHVNAQCPKNSEIWQHILSIEDSVNNDGASMPSHLKDLYKLKTIFQSCALPHDSVYARLLHRIGYYENVLNNDMPNNISIAYMLEALKINTSGRKDCSPSFAIKSCINLGYYYKKLSFYSKALDYFDSTIFLSKKFPDQVAYQKQALLQKIVILQELGDYEKCSDECLLLLNLALNTKDSSFILYTLNQRAQAFLYQSRFNQSSIDADNAFNIATSLKDISEIATSLKNKALISAAKRNNIDANYLFNKSIALRLQSDKNNIPNDFIDKGNFYLNQLLNYDKSKESYLTAIKYAAAQNGFLQMAKAHVNLGQVSFHQKKYDDALKYNFLACNDLGFNIVDILNTPKNRQVKSIANKELAFVLFYNTSELFLNIYKNTGDKKYLDASLRTAKLTDSIITDMRTEQSANGSKLYWRQYSRTFFTNALEACYLAGDTKNAFYFMEKSRAVLLNDKLNELGANAQLSTEDAEKEQSFQIKIITGQQKLSEIPADTKAYHDQQNKLFTTKDDFQSFTKSLGKKYPAYYEYKYADSVPKITDLQKQLGVNHQSFVHYFMNDTVMYILSITPGDAKMIKLSKNEFDVSQINRFLQYCSNKSLLNADYSSFATLSNSVYKILFQKLELPKGRVIICSDNFLIPFEALCSDTNGKQFLIYDYTFSYVYSATYLLKDFKTYPAKGNFIGFAPVNFRGYLDVASLSESATALKKSASNYNNTLLFANEAATKNSFIQKISGYSVVNVFSHASADSSYTEPRIYMQDSVVKLSDLQLLTKPATRLVVLSACQTNVGKNATGEGIYSLARGFASAGIPAVSATLWNADENMIYEVSATFHQYLSRGMSKDSALQKAKLDFINNNKNSGKLLPYYWANMVLIGNAEPLQLSTGSSVWIWAGAVFLVVLTAFIFITVQRKKQHSK